jgi:hypothetical protein
MTHTVSVDMTTHCSRRCPDCCCGIGINRVLQHHPWEYFVAAAPFLKGINRIHLTGGEPTFHPQFAEIVPRLRSLFECKILTLATNGWGVARYADLIVETFDYVGFSDYHDGFTEELEKLARRIRVDRASMGKDAALFLPRSKPGGGKPCSRAASFGNGGTYADGKFWGCCVAPGLADAQPVDPSSNWQADMMTAYIPCSTCFFSDPA